MSPSAAPPSPQEINRKLSIHSVARIVKSSNVPTEGAVSGTESDSDSVMLSGASAHVGGLHVGASVLQQPLSSIAERPSGSGEDSEEEEEEGGWKSADIRVKLRDSVDESVIKSGYLWKKGERRKTWKKRWFVLRTAHLAYYKSSAEYELLRILELSDVHSCTPVVLKKHENTFGLISPVRTYYLQAKTPQEVREWVQAIEQARESLTATSTRRSMPSPIPIPTPTRQLSPQFPLTPSSSSRVAPHNVTSSDSEDALPGGQGTYLASTQDRTVVSSSPTKVPGLIPSDSAKVILAGYLMKCGSKRHNWRKRWFTLTGGKLVYSGSHMDTKPHGQFSFSQILDAFEYDLPSTRHIPPALASPTLSASPASDMDDPYATHTFKIVTTKRTLLLCAPTEEDEIKWLGAVRALIARRSGTGTMPGETSNVVQAPGLQVGGSAGIKSKVRRLSINTPMESTQETLK